MARFHDRFQSFMGEDQNSGSKFYCFSSVDTEEYMGEDEWIGFQ